MSVVLKYWHTLKHLKLVQIRYQLYYKLRKVLPQFLLSEPTHAQFEKYHTAELTLKDPIVRQTSYLLPNTFRFLNIDQQFDSIDWNYPKHGKLWVYNLNYFDFLLQESLEPEKGVELMLDFGKCYNNLKDGKEPYPTSLRIMNWVTFVAKHKVENKEIDFIIFKDLLRLTKNLEYHLLGNHLLENAFALFFGAAYFNHDLIYNKAEQLLFEQLEEQILTDGAHFELSPMYHQIILSRLLSSIDLLRHNNLFGSNELLVLMERKSELMLGWLLAMTFRNGDLPRVNDSTSGIAPSLELILQQANNLSLKVSDNALKESGYRKIKKSDYEFLADVGHIGPDYIPGHAHSDTFNFILYVKDEPVIVDTGISTYEKNALRQSERSTGAHNTVVVNEQDQTEVWGGFRVAKRASVKLIEDAPTRIVATHNGYRSLGITHQRSFEFVERSIRIQDTLTKSSKAVAYLHFHPDVELEMQGDILKLESCTISIEGAESIQVQPYAFAEAFNQTRQAKKVEISFSQKMTTHIQVE